MRTKNKSIKNIASVTEYNNLLGIETPHPLVNVIDLSQLPPMRHSLCNFGFYAIFLKEVKCGDLRYGRQYYDYQEGTLVCIAPGQISGVEDDGKPYQPKGKALVFQPDLIKGTTLGRNIKRYTFFSYEANEALHLSDSERTLVLDCLQNISNELHHSIDRHSKTLIASNIELLLNYCVRFYDRQFITRENTNKDLLVGFEHLLNSYFDSDLPQTKGLLTVGYCAECLHLSANYFGDLVKKETGKTPQEHIQMKLIDTAKERVLGSGDTISEIAYRLGFRYPQHFTRLFKKLVGCTPNEYRDIN